MRCVLGRLLSVGLLLIMTGSLLAQDQPPVPTVLPDSEAWFQMGMEMLANHDSKASEVFARAIAADPNNWQAMLMRAMTFDCLRDSDADHAFKGFNQALTIKPDESAIFLGRGNCYFTRGETDRALSDYAEAVRLNPASAEAALNGLLTGVIFAGMHGMF